MIIMITIFFFFYIFLNYFNSYYIYIILHPPLYLCSIFSPLQFYWLHIFILFLYFNNIMIVLIFYCIFNYMDRLRSLWQFN